LQLGYGDAEWDLFGREAECRECPRPDLPWSDDELFPPGGEGWRLAPTTPERRYAWARGLSAMREQMTEDSQARLVIAGDLRKFQGLVPGVVEEAWLSLKARKPLYLAGAFGGAARAVADLLAGVERSEFSEADARDKVPSYEAAVACYHRHGGSFRSMEAIGNNLREWSGKGLEAALNNGLDDDENWELMRTTEAPRIAELVLTGLTRL
jgi:hypothetical protein